MSTKSAGCKKPCIFYFLHGGNNLDSKYITEVSNSTETKEDIRFGYVKATIINNVLKPINCFYSNPLKKRFLNLHKTYS